MDKSLVIAAAREASQTAEDARALAGQRARDAEIASARSSVEHERELRVAAEARAESAQQALHAQTQGQAAQAETAAQAEITANRMQQEEMRQTPTQSTPAIDYSTIKPPPPIQSDDRPQRVLRAS